MCVQAPFVTVRTTDRTTFVCTCNNKLKAFGYPKPCPIHGWYGVMGGRFVYTVNPPITDAIKITITPALRAEDV